MVKKGGVALRLDGGLYTGGILGSDGGLYTGGLNALDGAYYTGGFMATWLRLLFW